MNVVDVAIIGAGPAGAVAAALLRRRGRRVLVLEREQFPRFSIGESLLPHSMEFIEAAGLLRPVIEAGFQFKCGAVFARNELRCSFDFRDKFTPGWSTTFQVERAAFDKVLADGAAAMGAEFRYQHSVLAAEFPPGDSERDASPQARLRVRGPDGDEYEVEAAFVLDASGFGRVLPRLLDLETPSGFPTRMAVFTHVQDGFALREFDRSRILVSVHPRLADVWYWAIPFPNGRCSVGVVAEPARIESLPGAAGTDLTARLRALIDADANQRHLFRHAVWDTPARQIIGYAANVRALSGPGWALLGNAGEFLDPVFSSGVTIAVRSASMAAHCVDRSLAGEAVDWEADYSRPLRRGVDTFRAFVEAWYSGEFQKVIFHPRQDPEIRRMICAILAGYAWDESNPYVAQPRRLRALSEQCATV